MHSVSIDFETYSEGDIRKLGIWNYSKDPTTEVICMAYAIEEEAPVIWLPGMKLPDFVKDPSSFHLHAWNTLFEYCIWHYVLHWSPVPLGQWTDTAAHSAALAMPRGLSACGAALNLPQDKQKDKRGKYLIQRLCKPYRGKRVQDAHLLQEMYKYCMQDVVAEHEISKRLYPLSPLERQVWELDQVINIRGVFIDTQALKDALVILGQVNQELNEEVSRITQGALVNVSQRARVIEYVASIGFTMEKFDKAYLETLLKSEDLPPIARRLIEIRLEAWKISTAKYTSLNHIVSEDHRGHGLLVYHGAATGRWSGKYFQPQNLTRPSFQDTQKCIDLFKFQDIARLREKHKDPMEALSSSLRGMICAPPGKRILVADYSAIEARVLAWLAGQEDVLDVFKSHGKIYEYTATKIFKVQLENVNKEQRFIGKVATLALGYQGGAKAFQRIAELYGVDIDSDEAEIVKSDWRSANSKITRFWRHIGNAAKSAVIEPEQSFKVRGIRFRSTNDYLFCCLPSGRLLAYPQPRIATGKFDVEQVTFMGTNSITRKWERQETYGGKLVENITQAVARDLMAEAMLRIEQAGYSIVLSIHDELIAEAVKGFGNIKNFESLMCQLPQWAEGLPIHSEVFEYERYRK